MALPNKPDSLGRAQETKDRLSKRVSCASPCATPKSPGSFYFKHCSVISFSQLLIFTLHNHLNPVPTPTNVTSWNSSQSEALYFSLNQVSEELALCNMSL
ncbi:hypothetical protein CDAR_250471 [Caerostris darwini]|uniref:Uncharacterized protein n=1 Tax=Caerostris darwini TaxID=1538125 RepID=A0AAV4UE99_9ARAC|nr:hypothetical protein CDAR_250471 [Caerostris darwini]